MTKLTNSRASDLLAHARTSREAAEAVVVEFDRRLAKRAAKESSQANASIAKHAATNRAAAARILAGFTPKRSAKKAPAKAEAEIPSMAAFLEGLSAAQRKALAALLA